MTIDELNRRYGAPGRIVFRTGFAGYPEVVLANKFGTAEISLLGANVLSYRPTGHSPVLFRPAKRDYNRDRPCPLSPASRTAASTEEVRHGPNRHGCSRAWRDGTARGCVP